MKTVKKVAFIALAAGMGVGFDASAQRNPNADLYQTRCAGCHGVSGQGTRMNVPPLAPALKGNPFVQNGSLPAIAQVIRKGRTGQRRLYDDVYGNMVGFGPELVPDAEALAAYLKNELQN